MEGRERGPAWRTARMENRKWTAEDTGRREGRSTPRAQADRKSKIANRKSVDFGPVPLSWQDRKSQFGNRKLISTDLTSAALSCLTMTRLDGNSLPSFQPLHSTEVAFRVVGHARWWRENSAPAQLAPRLGRANLPPGLNAERPRGAWPPSKPISGNGRGRAVNLSELAFAFLGDWLTIGANQSNHDSQTQSWTQQQRRTFRNSA